MAESDERVPMGLTEREFGYVEFKVNAKREPSWAVRVPFEGGDKVGEKADRALDTLKRINKRVFDEMASDTKKKLPT